MKPGTTLTALVVILFLGASAGKPRAEPARVIRLSAASLWAVPVTGRGSERFIVGDTVEIVARRTPLLGYLGVFAPTKDPLAALRARTVHHHFPASLDFKGRPAVPLSAMLRPRTVELSRFSCLVHGADLGAGTASSLAGLGLVTGVMGQKSAGYLLGASAILGALWGGTIGANDPNFRVRVGMDDPGGPWDRFRSQPDADPGLTRPPH